jgi:nucleoside-diphosphate kinase
LERTLLVVKPDAVAAGRTGEILRRVEAAGFVLTGLSMRRLSRPEAERFYAIHQGKDFFAGLVEFIVSGPVVAALLEGDDARGRLRRFIGATDPARAEPGTVRADFGSSVRRNAVHASNPVEDVEGELRFFFPESNRCPQTQS